MVRAQDGATLQISIQPRLLVASIGSTFMPGVRESIEAAVEAFQKSGGFAWHVTQKNICIISHMGLEATRNFILMRAQEWRMDYVALVEDDVLITDPQTFVKLVRHRVQIISPYFDQSELVPPDSGYRHMLHEPLYQAKQGLLPVLWTVRSCVVFDTQAFRFIGNRPFIDTPIYDTDRYHGLYFKTCNVQWWLDTDMSVKLLRAPNPAWRFKFRLRYPGDKTEEELTIVERKHADLYAQAQAAKVKRGK